MSTASSRQSVRSSLRAATAADHGRVDAFFRNGLRDARDYRVYLRGLHAALSGVSPSLDAVLAGSRWDGFPQQDRIDALAADLDALSLSPLAMSRPPQVSTIAAAAGVLYVMEGSSLGARLLVEDARGLGWTADTGASFLHLHSGDGAALRWRAFVARLEASRFEDDGGEDAMMAAAAATFAYTEQEFLRARTADVS